MDESYYENDEDYKKFSITAMARRLRMLDMSVPIEEWDEDDEKF